MYTVAGFGTPLMVLLPLFTNFVYPKQQVLLVFVVPLCAKMHVQTNRIYTYIPADIDHSYSNVYRRDASIQRNPVAYEPYIMYIQMMCVLDKCRYHNNSHRLFIFIFLHRLVCAFEEWDRMSCG